MIQAIMFVSKKIISNAEPVKEVVTESYEPSDSVDLPDYHKKLLTRSKETFVLDTDVSVIATRIKLSQKQDSELSMIRFASSSSFTPMYCYHSKRTSRRS